MYSPIPPTQIRPTAQSKTYRPSRLAKARHEAVLMIQDGFSPAKVQITTGLSRKEVKRLYQSFPARQSQWQEQLHNPNHLRP